MSIFDWKHWAVKLLIALVLFGGKRMRHLGADLGGSITGFRRLMAVATDTNESKPAAHSRSHDES